VILPKLSGVTRRELLKSSGALAAGASLANLVLPRVHAAENADSETIQVALIGAGGRGSGAADNALSTAAGPTKLVAIADVFEKQVKNAESALKSKHGEKVDVPAERQFVGFDAYKKAMDCLRPGDIAIFATPPGFRWVHFTYAIEKGLNVFMEKPVSVDGPTSRKMFALAEESEKKGMKVGVGLMCRHCHSRKELFNRIKDGEIGEILMLRAYRLAGPTASAFTLPKPASEKMSDLAYQIQNFHSFLWLSGGAYSDFLIHNIDECCWMKDAWPVKAQTTGGRHFRGDYIDQNFDSYATEYTFADGTKFLMEGRCMPGCHQEFSSYAHGSKAAAVISSSGHAPSRCRTYKAQKMANSEIAWRCPRDEPDPYQLEWDDLVTAIRENLPYNEAKRGTEASLVTAMGRMAGHTGQVITYDDMLACEHDFGADIDQLASIDANSPLMPDANGRYPVPEPGIKVSKEF
jgi:predicted dehydrogenase